MEPFLSEFAEPRCPADPSGDHLGCSQAGRTPGLQDPRGSARRLPLIRALVVAAFHFVGAALFRAWQEGLIGEESALELLVGLLLYMPGLLFLQEPPSVHAMILNAVAWGVAAACLSLVVRRLLRPRWWRHLPAGCSSCGYDTAGLPREGICPECGHGREGPASKVA